LKIDRLKQFGFGQAEFFFEDRSQQRPTRIFVVHHTTLYIMDNSSLKNPVGLGTMPQAFGMKRILSTRSL